MNPGVTINCDASMTSAPGGTRTASGIPISAMNGPSMTRRAGENFLSGVYNEPASTTRGRGSFTAASQISEDFAKIAVRLGKAFLRFLAIAAGGAHDDSNLQLSTGCLNETLRLFVLYT